MNRLLPRNIAAAIVMLFFIVFAGTAYYVKFEHYGWINALYMTVITLTTVGFGEIEPLSQTGRVFTMFILLSGFGILTYVITSGISFMLEGELGSVLRRRKMEKLLASIKNHHIICATGEIGEYVIDEFVTTKRDIVVITTDKALHEKLAARDIPVIQGNPAEDDVLLSAKIESATGLATALGDDKYNLFVVLSARGLNPNIRIIAQTIEKHSAMKIKKAGADEVVLTDAIGGMRIASAMLRPTVVSFLDGMLKNSEGTLRVEEATIKEHSGLSGKTIHENKITEKTGLLILAVKNSVTGKYIYNPPQDFKIHSGDVLIAIGNPDQVKKLYEIAGK